MPRSRDSGRRRPWRQLFSCEQRSGNGFRQPRTELSPTDRRDGLCDPALRHPRRMRVARDQMNELQLE